MLMTELDLRHPVIAAGLALHGMNPAELNGIVQRTRVSYDFGEKAGRPGLPKVHVGRDRCWVGWDGTDGAGATIFRLSSPAHARAGVVSPLQQVALPSTRLPDSVMITLEGRPLSHLVAMPGDPGLRIATAEQGKAGLVVTLQPFYEIEDGE